MPTPASSASPRRRSSTSLEVVPESVQPSDLHDALRRTQAEAQREAILWQRSVRYLGALLGLLLTLVFGSVPQEVSLPPVLIACAVYVAIVLGASWQLKRSDPGVLHPLLPTILGTADIGVITAFFYFASSEQVHYRLLLIGLLVVLLSVFYFGKWLGGYVAALTGAAYLFIQLAAPPFAGGVRATGSEALFTTLTFALVCAVVVRVLGGFRDRLNHLRSFCKLVEDGELTVEIRTPQGPHPDDLTLLARSFEAMRDRFAEQIGTDALTGCVNRRTLENRLRSDCRLARRRGSEVAVVAIDLDHFKDINDSRGHPMGDLVLRQLAGIMKATARDTDTVARLGGDEFVIVLPDTGSEGALAFAERLRHRVEEFAFGTEASVVGATVSIGVALATAAEPISPEVLLHEADRSLYKAKSGGRNRVYC